MQRIISNDPALAPLLQPFPDPIAQDDPGLVSVIQLPFCSKSSPLLKFRMNFGQTVLFDVETTLQVFTVINEIAVNMFKRNVFIIIHLIIRGQ